MPYMISIHSPLAGRDTGRVAGGQYLYISIHSPLAGRDDNAEEAASSLGIFQSTRPSRGETRRVRQVLPDVYISIHSPLAGRDWTARRSCWAWQAFQSTRPSRGETPPGAKVGVLLIFQSTRPSRGETANSDKVLPAEIIHIAQLISLQIRK